MNMKIGQKDIDSKVVQNHVSRVSPKFMTKAPGILIVDDNVDLCTDLAFEFKALGFETRMAHNGLKAAKIWEEYSEDIFVIVSDIRMPQQTGLSLLETVREKEDLIFVFMTGYDFSVHQKDTRIDAYFTKPFDYSSLLDKVMSLFGDKFST